MIATLPQEMKIPLIKGAVEAQMVLLTAVQKTTYNTHHCGFQPNWTVGVNVINPQAARISEFLFF